MDRRALLRLAVAALAAPGAAFGQAPGRSYRIALLDDAGEDARKADWASFRARLRELGIAEGKNAVFDARYAHGEHDRLTPLASELVAAKPDIIVVPGTPSTRAAMRATSNIPIVFLSAADPVGTGLVVSLARPGRNVTGISIVSTETTQKTLDLLHQLVPEARRVAFLTDPNNQNAASVFSRLTENASKLKISIQMLDVIGRTALERAFTTIRKERVQALLVGTPGPVANHRDEIIQFAAREKLPAVYGRIDFVAAGGLMAYGADRTVGARRTAEYVQRILQGAKAGDIPVEQVSTIRMVVNLKTARALGIKIPESIRLRADEVIE